MADNQFLTVFSRIKREMMKVIVGYDGSIDDLLICFFAGGNLLIESMPGLGKTMLVKVLSETLAIRFSRIQFTPDLMPADIIGTNIIVEDERGAKHIQFQKGPVFTNILLADEINRATPKAQSALLEAMQEHSVTVGGKKHQLAEPFIVIATQSLLETEGTYNLPEAQVDRFFFKITLSQPDRENLREISKRTTGLETTSVSRMLSAEDIQILQTQVRRVGVGKPVREYASRLCSATHPELPVSPESIKRFVRYGASPRAVQAMILGGKVRALLAGRSEVKLEDVTTVVFPSIRHRIILNFEGEAERVDTDTLVKDVLEQVRPVASAHRASVPVQAAPKAQAPEAAKKAPIKIKIRKPS